MRRFALPFFLFPGLLPLSLAGCHASYSPNTYAAAAAQQEAAVQRGVIIGVRQVLISADGVVGTATGGAAGGVAGAQLSGSPEVTALGAIGGALVGGVGGAAAERAIADTNGWEYIVQQTNGNLVSVTQTSKTALPIGLHVLVINGSKQARIVPDYTVQVPPPASRHPASAGGSTATPNQLGKTQSAVITSSPLAAPAQSPASATAATPAAASSGSETETSSPKNTAAPVPAIAGTSSSASFPVIIPSQASPASPADATSKPTASPAATTAAPVVPSAASNGANSPAPANDSGSDMGMSSGQTTTH